MMGMIDSMYPNLMLDYALRQLDSSAREQVDRELAEDPAAADAMDRLTRSIHLLLDDGETFDPPPQLASRTLAFVAEATRRRRTILDFVPVSVPFRPADLAVAAGIFIAGLITLLPAMQKSRERMEIAGCSYNLQQLGRALWQYGTQHQHYPFAPEQHPGGPVGAYVAQLRDGGTLSDLEINTLHCPHVAKDKLSNPQDAANVKSLGYAYNVGYRLPSGTVAPIRADHTPNIALLADQPAHVNFQHILPGNSPNHGGRGQNVLYADLHIGWHNTRRLTPKDDDMFTNSKHELQPGLSPEDTSLLPSLVPCLGW